MVIHIGHVKCKYGNMAFERSLYFLSDGNSVDVCPICHHLSDIQVIMCITSILTYRMVTGQWSCSL